MKALTFQIHLKEPVLVTPVRNGDPNSAISYNFIPGSVMRGAMISKYLQAEKKTNDDFFNHFFDGTICFLNAYPQTKTGERSLPAPLSWRADKDALIKKILNIAIPEENEKVENSGIIWKGVKEPFCYLKRGSATDKVELCNPSTQIQIHTARGNRQRSTEGEEGTIFRYASIDAGQKFSGAIIAESIFLEKYIKPLLSGNETFNLGKSHLAGYGRVKIEKIEIQENWMEYERINNNLEDTITVTLLSDAILRDNITGAHVATLEPVIEAKHEKAFVRNTIMGGFNRTWGLPLPQTLAIKAGSVFVYKDNAELRKRLTILENTGIGERREEGFGRISIDCIGKRYIDIVEPESPPQENISLDGESALIAKMIVKQIMRSRLDQSLIKQVNSLKIHDPPNRSQLSRMRTIALRALTNNNANEIIDHLDRLRKTARDQFQQAKISGTTLENWLYCRGENVQSVWDIIGITSIQQPGIGGIYPEFEDLALEYTVRLINGVLHKSIKEAKK